MLLFECGAGCAIPLPEITNGGCAIVCIEGLGAVGGGVDARTINCGAVELPDDGGASGAWVARCAGEKGFPISGVLVGREGLVLGLACADDGLMTGVFS